MALHGSKFRESSLHVQVEIFAFSFVAILLCPVAMSTEVSKSSESSCTLQDLSLENLRRLNVQELASCQPPLLTVTCIILALASNPSPTQWPSVLEREICRPLSCTSEALDVTCTLTAQNCFFIEGEINKAIESTFSSNFILRQLGVDALQVPAACF